MTDKQPSWKYKLHQEAAGGMGQEKGRGFCSCYGWHPSSKSRYHLCPSHLDAHDNILVLDHLNKRCTIVRLLVHGLMEEDDTTDTLLNAAVCAEEDLPVQPAILLRVLHPDLVQALGHASCEGREEEGSCTEISGSTAI